MANSEKDAVIQEVSDIFKKSKSVFVTDFSGLNVEKIMILRKKFRESKVGYLVVKNTLARISAEKAGWNQLNPHFKGPSAIAYSFEDPSSPARVIKEFTKNNDKPKIKGSIFEGVYYGPESMDQIASLPPKQELLARVVGAFNSPIQGLASRLNGILQKLVGTLDAVKTQKEKNA